MSDTEIIPEPNLFLAEPNGLTCWRASYDRIMIEPGPYNGKHLLITVDNKTMAEFHLSENDVAHFISLLS